MLRVFVISLLLLGCAAQNSTLTDPGEDYPVSWKTYIFVLMLILIFVALLLSIAPVFSILCSGAVMFHLLGIIGDEDLFAGLVNNGVLSIAMLFIVVHPVVELPLMKLMIEKVLGSTKPTSEVPSRAAWMAGADALSPELLSLGRWARAKVCLLSMITSPFLENTPQVAMFTPLISRHCRKIGLAPSQILMPMAFAVLLGNYYALGFSSNLVVSGLMEKQNLGELPILDLAKVNLPLLVPIMVYLVFCPRFLLPLRRGGLSFIVKLKVTHGSQLIGRSVSEVFADFVAKRTESSERISVHRKQFNSTTSVGQRLTWEKVGEPFCRLMTLQAGDEVVVNGLLATLGQPEREIATEDQSELSNYVSPMLEDGYREAINASDNVAAPLAAFHAGEIEGHWHDIFVAAMAKPPSESATSPLDSAPLFRQRSDTVISSSGPLPFLGHQTLIRNFSEQYSVLVLTMKASFEGVDLAKDADAYSKCTNIAANPNLLVAPETRPDDEEETHGSHHAPRSSPRTSTLLERQAKQSLSWRDWHELHGGRLFKASVPSWFPVGAPETIDVDENVEKPVTDMQDPHHVTSYDDTGKNKAKWKVVEMPWWYQYLSLGVFLAIVIASFFNAKLSVSCFVACAACVVLRLISTKQLVKALPVEIYLLTAFSFPLGSAMQKSGLAGSLGHAMEDANLSGISLLYLIGIVTIVLTNMITAQGAAQVIFPLVVKVYQVQGGDPHAGILMMVCTLSVALCTPFAIPSNAVILVPGGYTPIDYLKFGFPLSAGVLLLVGLMVAAIFDTW